MSRLLRSSPLWFLASAAGAQSTPTVTLESPASAAQEFTRVVSARELADGRLLVSDRGDNRVLLVSFDGKPAVALGQVGAGPGEYRVAGALVPLPGDSTALIDPRNGRWLIFAGGRIAGTLARDGKIESIPVGVSATHEFMYTYSPNGLGASPDDSVGLVRTDRRTRKSDTVAFLVPQSAHRSAPKREERYTVVHITISEWTAGDQAILFDDGWVAIARVSPYAVDWLSPDGKLRRGKPLRASDPPYTEAEKRAYLARIADLTGKPPAAIDSRSDWPDVVTAFTSASPILGGPNPALFAAPRGMLLVRRQPTAASPEQRYDVIDRASNVVAQLVLGRRETLVGSGRAHLFSVVTDDDGIQRIRRYDWPALTGR